MQVIRWPPPEGGELITVIRMEEVILSNVLCAIQQQDEPPPDYKAWLPKPDKEIIAGDIVKRGNNRIQPGRIQPGMPEITENDVSTVADNSELLVIGVTELDSSSVPIAPAPVTPDPFGIRSPVTEPDLLPAPVAGPKIGTPDSTADIFIELDLNKADSDDPDGLWRQILSSRRMVVSEVERYYRDEDGRRHKTTTRIYEEFDESYGDWITRKMEVYFDVVGGFPSADYHHTLVVDPQWELVRENWTKLRVLYDRAMEVDTQTGIPRPVMEVDTRTGIPRPVMEVATRTGIPRPVEIGNPYNDYMRIAQQQAEEEEELTLEKD